MSESERADDIDFYLECARFVSIIANNAHSRLAYLDMSGNLIGSAENLNVVNPDLVTGGEVLQ